MIGKEKKIITLVIFPLWLLFCFCIPFLWRVNSGISAKEKQERKRTAIHTDWQKIYPFPPTSCLKEYVQNERVLNLLHRNTNLKQKYTQTVQKFQAKIEDRINGNMPFLQVLTDTYCYFWKFAGLKKMQTKDEVDIMALDNGFFTFGQPVYKDYKEHTRDIKNMQEYLKGKNAKFLYLNCPFKFATNGTHYYMGWLDYMQENYQRFMQELKKQDVCLVDLEETLKEQNMNKLDLFFKTDHHWDVFAGLWGARQLAQELNKNYGFKIDVSMLENKNFDVFSYPYPYLGSIGNQTTTAFAKTEEFSFPIPRYKTQFSMNAPYYDTKKEGSFADICVNIPELRDVNNIYSFMPSMAFCYNCGMDIMQMKNELIDIPQNKKKVLFIHDSFANYLVPYIALCIEDIMLVDTRAFNGSLETLMNEYKPDTVIMLYCSWH